MAPRTARPRYLRLAAAGGAVAITAVAVLGGSGLLPVDDATEPVAQQASLAMAPAVERARVPGPARDDAEVDAAPGEVSKTAPEAESLDLPADSGAGRRVVFDMSDQRVWLVGRTGAVRRTYLVSGSLTDNLGPGTYEVYSRSEQAWGIDDSGTMKYFVRFTRGERAAIGFHDIPIKDGAKVQTRAELGTPQSHGCVRQWRPDAKALWTFAPVGTTVVVVA